MRSLTVIVLALGVGGAVAALPPTAKRVRPQPEPAGRIACSAGPLDPGRADVYVYDLGTKKLTRIAGDHRVELDPALSPDGRRVAWRSIRNGNEEVRVADVDGTGVRNLTRNAALD